MKKLIVVSLAAAGVALTSAPVMADDHGKKKVWGFNRIDTNNNGTVSLAEWEAANHAAAGHASADTDGNGELTLEEYQAQLQRWREARERREAAKQ